MTEFPTEALRGLCLSHGADAFGARPKYAPGQRVGDFRLTRELKKTPFGAVWEVEWSGRRLAMKVLVPPKGLTSSFALMPLVGRRVVGVS